MKAKIAKIVGLITATLCAVGIILTAIEYSLFADFNGGVVGVSVLIILLGLYATALLLKKLKMVWIVISVWTTLWLIAFTMLILEIGVGDFSGPWLFLVVLAAWYSYVFEHFFGTAGFLDSEFGAFCGFLFIAFLLCVGAFGLKQSKMTNNKSEEETLTTTETKKVR